MQYLNYMSWLRVNGMPLHLSSLVIAAIRQKWEVSGTENWKNAHPTTQKAEVVPVEVPRLKLVLRVLEHDLDELEQVEPGDGHPGVRRRPPSDLAGSLSSMFGMTNGKPFTAHRRRPARSSQAPASSTSQCSGSRRRPTRQRRGTTTR